MILYHITKYKLGSNFKATRPTCCAPTIPLAILGLQDLIHYKKSGRKNVGIIYIYKCDTENYYNGNEFDSSIIKEKIVKKNTKFNLVGTISISDVQFLQKILDVLHEGHGTLTKYKSRLTSFYKTMAFIVKDAYNYCSPKYIRKN